MRKHLYSSTLFLTLISIPFVINPGNAFAQSTSHHPYDHGYGDGYEDGYDDGYDDAMDDCPCPPYRYLSSGFYLGAGVGYEGFQIDRQAWAFDEHIGRLNTHANGWNGRFFGGYGRYFNNFYLGGEAFVGTSGANGKDSINTFGLEYSGKFSAGTSYGFSALPGYKLSKAGPLVFARLGYISTDFTVKDNASGNGGNNSNWTGGFNTGLGVEVPIYQKWSARLEYDYIDYSTFRNNGINGSKNSPSDNRGSLDFLFHF